MPDLIPYNSAWGSSRMLPDGTLGEVPWARQVNDNLGWMYAEPRVLVTARLTRPTETPTGTRYYHIYTHPLVSNSRNIPMSFFFKIETNHAASGAPIGSFRWSYGGTDTGGNVWHGTTNLTAVLENATVPTEWREFAGTWWYNDVPGLTAGTMSVTLIANFGERCTVIGSLG